MDDCSVIKDQVILSGNDRGGIKNEEAMFTSKLETVSLFPKKSCVASITNSVGKAHTSYNYQVRTEQLVSMWLDDADESCINTFLMFPDLGDETEHNSTANATSTDSSNDLNDFCTSDDSSCYHHDEETQFSDTFYHDSVVDRMLDDFELDDFDDDDTIPSISRNSPDPTSNEFDRNTKFPASSSNTMDIGTPIDIGPNLQTFLNCIRDGDGSQISDDTLAPVLLEMFLPLFPQLRPGSDDILLGHLLDFIVAQRNADIPSDQPFKRVAKPKPDPNRHRMKNRKVTKKYKKHDLQKEKERLNKEEKERQKSEERRKKARKAENDGITQQAKRQGRNFEPGGGSERQHFCAC